MSSAALQDGSLPVQLPPLPVRGAENSASAVDPAQAALILLLAGEIGLF